MKHFFKGIGVVLLIGFFAFIALFISSRLALPADAASLGERLEGKILLQVEDHGEAWYVHNGKRYYMKNGDVAYRMMRFFSLGITNNDLSGIPVGDDLPELEQAQKPLQANLEPQTIIQYIEVPADTSAYVNHINTLQIQVSRLEDQVEYWKQKYEKEYALNNQPPPVQEPIIEPCSVMATAHATYPDVSQTQYLVYKGTEPSYEFNILRKEGVVNVRFESDTAGTLTPTDGWRNNNHFSTGSYSYISDFTMSTMVATSTTLAFSCQKDGQDNPVETSVKLNILYQSEMPQN